LAHELALFIIITSAAVSLFVLPSVDSVNAQNISGNETTGNMTAITNVTNATVSTNMTDTRNIAPSTPVIPN
jgi:hypothetical protein